jgi:hypothetical protein
MKHSSTWMSEILPWPQLILWKFTSHSKQFKIILLTKQKRELRTNNTTNMQWNTIQHHHNFLDHHIADLTMPTSTEHYTITTLWIITKSAKKNSTGSPSNPMLGRIEKTEVPGRSSSFFFTRWNAKRKQKNILLRVGFSVRKAILMSGNKYAMV